jgi:glycosyltransferase involved in cell wall biosynthesis
VTRTVDILVPIFNDVSKLERFEIAYMELLPTIPAQYQLSLIFVDDGSSDQSLQNLIEMSSRVPRCTVIELSRNFGKEAALAAGYGISNGEAVICIDVDLQDPIELIPRMLEKWNFDEFDSVIAVRSQTEGEKGFRRFISRLYLTIFNRLTDMGIELNAGETRLINRKMVLSFNQLGESVRFTRGIYKWLGFRTACIEFVRLKSPEKSSFTTRKLLQLGWNGIISFSALPLRLVSIAGIVGSCLTLFLCVLVVALRLFSIVTIPGYSSTLLIILFSSSVQLFCMGILGEYIGKTLLEVKRRPIYLIREVTVSK